MACAAASVFAAGASAASLPDVTGQLNASRAGTRAKAAQDVIDRRATASADALVAAVRTEAIPELRIRLLTAAFAVDSTSATPALIAALRGDKSPLVREMSAGVLSRLSPEDDVRKAFLDVLAKDANAGVRRACATGLGFQPAPDSLKALTAAASDSDPELRRRAGLALTRHPQSAARDRALDQLESDRDPSVAASVRAERAARTTIP